MKGFVLSSSRCLVVMMLLELLVVQLPSLIWEQTRSRSMSRELLSVQLSRISLYRHVDGKARSVGGSKMLGDKSIDIETFRRGVNTWFLFGPICALMVLRCAETLDSLSFYSRLSSELRCSYYLQSIWQSLGGCNVAPMVAALDDPELAPLAVEALSKTILMFDEKFDVEEK